MIRNSLCSLALACTVALAGSALAETAPDQEIQYLLQFVSDSGCTFVRNGDQHDAAGAADHLRLKYDRGRRHVDSAEQFIDRLATKSSWSGDAYTVTCAGKTQTSAQWLHRALAEYRQPGGELEP
jgi:hypothetical protein